MASPFAKATPFRCASRYVNNSNVIVPSSFSITR